LQKNSLLDYLAQKVHTWTSNKNMYYD